mmetsp:Transcript_15070/g.27768  ORF Transcript_15070/g.27768 Transcript_15070/m.27768 type:complete len:243 (+) Transcript_15070:64-792(+)
MSAGINPLYYVCVLHFWRYRLLRRCTHRIEVTEASDLRDLRFPDELRRIGALLDCSLEPGVTGVVFLVRAARKVRRIWGLLVGIEELEPERCLPPSISAPLLASRCSRAMRRSCNSWLSRLRSLLYARRWPSSSCDSVASSCSFLRFWISSSSCRCRERSWFSLCLLLESFDFDVELRSLSSSPFRIKMRSRSLSISVVISMFSRLSRCNCFASLLPLFELPRQILPTRCANSRVRNVSCAC